MANIFKTTDSGGIVGMLRDFALAIRQFFGTKSEMDVVATALTDLDNRKIEASDIPASLPANGGNADTVDGEHASAFAHIGAHNNLTASGNEFTFASNGFSGAIWFNYRTAGGANGNITEYKFGNGKGGELGTAIHSGNYNSYSPTLTGTGASGTWGINISGNAATASNVAWNGVTNKPSSFTPSSHTHTKSEITDFPSSLPASDVYAWAKASTKPSYSWSEIDSRPTNVSAFTNDAGYITASNSKFGYYLPLSGGTITGQLYLTGLEEGSSDVTDNTELLTSYASNDGFSDTNATGKVYRRDAIKVYNYIKGKLDSVYSAIGHTHTTSQIIGFPTSLPANGGNADTVDGYHAADFVLKTTHDEHESVIAEALSDLDSRKVDIEDMPTSLPANGGDADTVDNYHASNLAKFYLSPMSSDAPASSAKSWFANTMPSASGAIIYNVPGSEKTIIAGKSSGSYGHMLQLNYDDTYLRVLRYQGGSWKSDDWEKISAGYADSAGTAGMLNGYTSDMFVQNITVRNVITGAPGTDAIVDATRTGSDVILDFTIPRGDKGEQGDMKELDVYKTDSCEVELSWVYHNPNLSATFADMIQVPVPSVEEMTMDADCIRYMSGITLNIGENAFKSDYEWKELHWLLRCSNTENIVYTTKYATPDASFQSVTEAIPNSPPTIIEISVSLQKDPPLRYVQVTVENMYGRAYYKLKQQK